MALTRNYGEDSWSLSENGEEILTVQEIISDREVLVNVSGSLRSDTEQFFQDELIALSTVGMDIIMDCKELKYIANACQLALLSVQQRMDGMGKGTLTLRNVPQDILKKKKKTNLHELLMIE